MKTCKECGSALTARQEDHRYTESGLPNVVLLGVEVRRCAKCKAYEVAIPGVAALHRAIAYTLIRKPSRFTGDEVRFLREFLGITGIAFAARMGVEPETVSRWQTGREPMGPGADRLLRLLVANAQPVDQYPSEFLETIDGEAPVKPERVRMKHRGAVWKADAHAVQ
jgi:putative zinc finger/helix-turn-helix YgiT family protein